MLEKAGLPPPLLFLNEEHTNNQLGAKLSKMQIAPGKCTISYCGRKCQANWNNNRRRSTFLMAMDNNCFWWAVVGFDFLFPRHLLFSCELSCGRHVEKSDRVESQCVWIPRLDGRFHICSYWKDKAENEVIPAKAERNSENWKTEVRKWRKEWEMLERCEELPLITGKCIEEELY